MTPACLTLSIIRYWSRIKWRNPGKGVAPSPTTRCSSYWKGSLRVAFDYSRQLIMLYIDLRPGQTCHSKDAKVAYSIGVGGLGWQYGTRSNPTVQSDWCTGWEWPVNCMTVISVWWQSNMPFQGQRKWHIPRASYGEILSWRLNYYITQRRQEVC